MSELIVDFNLDGSPFAAEWGLYGVTIVNFLVNLAAACYLVYWRKWPPIRAKQLDFLLLSAATGWIWLIGAYSATRAVPQVGAMLLCNFWQFWIQFAFGALLWLGCIILRMYRLYAILIVTNMRMNIKNPRLWMYARLAALCAPYFIFATIATALNATPVVSQPTSAGVNVEMCLMDSWALYMLVALCFVYLVPPVVLMYKLRNIRKFLNEFRETKFAFWCIVTGTIVYGFVTVMSWHNKVWGRVLCVAIILVMLNLSYWLIIGPTIVGRYFDPDATLAKFNAEKDYHPSSSSSKQNSASGKKHHSSSKKPISHRSDSSSRQPSEGITSGTDGTEFEVRLSQHEFSVVLPQEGTFEESNEEA